MDDSLSMLPLFIDPLPMLLLPPLLFIAALLLPMLPLVPPAEALAGKDCCWVFGIVGVVVPAVLLDIVPVEALPWVAVPELIELPVGMSCWRVFTLPVLLVPGSVAVPVLFCAQAKLLATTTVTAVIRAVRLEVLLMVDLLRVVGTVAARELRMTRP